MRQDFSNMVEEVLLVGYCYFHIYYKLILSSMYQSASLFCWIVFRYGNVWRKEMMNVLLQYKGEICVISKELINIIR